MEFKTFSEAELDKLSRKSIVLLYLQLSESFKLISEQNNQILEQNKELLTQVADLQEKVAILTAQKFGRQTEKTREMIPGQMSIDGTGNFLFLNEAEAVCDHTPEPEKTDEELLAEARAREEKRKRKPGVRQADFSSAEVETEDHGYSEEELAGLFPDGYEELPSKVTYRVEYEPAKVKVIREVIHQYKSASDGKIVMADHPVHLLAHSVVTPSLAAKIIYDKYVNAVPINRVAREFGWLDVVIRPPTMSRWVVRLTNEYLLPVFGRMETEIKKADLIHCDETPFVCTEDRKKKDSKTAKSYMWVMHTADQYGSPPIFLYHYRDNRRTESAGEILEGYKGIIMADGYEPYHTVARESNGDLVVAGCWAHCKRKFSEIIKADPVNARGTTAFEANEKIAYIYHMDNKKKAALAGERLKYRQEVIKPLVDEFFRWVRERDGKVATAATQRAITYALNQERYLREFLNNGIIPLDNSDAERSIRAFCVGKHNWHIVDTSSGAQASGILYSLAETAKANQLKPYEYFKYLFEQLSITPAQEQTDDFIASLLPWSDQLPEKIRSKKKNNN